MKKPTENVLLVCSEPFTEHNSRSGWHIYALPIINALAKTNKYELFFMYAVLNGGNPLIENLIDPSVNRIPFTLPKNKLIRLLFRLYPLKILAVISHLNKIDVIHLLSTEYLFANILFKLQKKV